MMNPLSPEIQEETQSGHLRILTQLAFNLRRTLSARTIGRRSLSCVSEAASPYASASNRTMSNRAASSPMREPFIGAMEW
jgi:hypothetical protein